MQWGNLYIYRTSGHDTDPGAAKKNHRRESTHNRQQQRTARQLETTELTSVVNVSLRHTSVDTLTTEGTVYSFQL